MSHITQIDPSKLTADDRATVVAELKSTHEKIPASSPVADLILQLIRAIDDDSRFTGITEDRELSPNDAATLLGISRPHLMEKYVRTGVLKARKEKSHYRIKASDVTDFIHRRDLAGRDVAKALASPSNTQFTQGLSDDDLSELDNL